jgi:hypothetical protein
MNATAAIKLEARASPVDPAWAQLVAAAAAIAVSPKLAALCRQESDVAD